MQPEIIEVRNPATLKKFAELPVASRAQVADAVARGRKAQALWQLSSYAHRAKLLYRLRDLLLDEQDKMADVLTAETVTSSCIFAMPSASGPRKAQAISAQRKFAHISRS